MEVITERLLYEEKKIIERGNISSRAALLSDQ